MLTTVPWVTFLDDGLAYLRMKNTSFEDVDEIIPGRRTGTGRSTESKTGYRRPQLQHGTRSAGFSSRHMQEGWDSGLCTPSPDSRSGIFGAAISATARHHSCRIQQGGTRRFPWHKRA